MGGSCLSSYLHVIVCLLLTITDKLAGWGGLEVVLPVGHTALSGDLEAHVTGGWAGLTGRLQLLERNLYPSGPILQDNQVDDEGSPDPDGWSSMGSIPLTWTNSSSLQVRFPCGVITRGGRYGIKLIADVINSSVVPSQIFELDVRWPSASLSLTPREIQTYPEGNVTATVTFQATFCQPALGSILPETWLDLLYCGHSPLGCTFPNSTHKQLVYSEQIRGYPTLRYVPLGCHLFGMAGHYALALRPTIQDPGEPIAATPPKTTLKALWSDKFVFNVHARSIFPCDGHSGVPVLFQYPKCILPSGDRVRLFSRLRADVSSLVPPTSLHYVSEQRVANGKHSLRFDCSLFSERYVEYCFVYVSQSITGAVSDVRMDCVPTLPVLDFAVFGGRGSGDSNLPHHNYETGGWGEWSPWTQCTSTCSGGTRNRYRFCDSPPPRYGAKFCQGHALETETCGVAGAWDCHYYPDTGSGEVPADRPEVKAEIGPGCRCGCIVHLGTGKSRRLIAASSHSCPGRTFWLIQTEKDRSVRLSMEQFRLPCVSQSLKIRDGDSSSGEMLARLSGTPLEVPPIISSGPSLLIEFNAGDVVTSGEECSGGFLAHASQVERQESNLSRALVAHSSKGPHDEAEMWSGPGLVNAGLALTLLFAVVASACLGIQYVYRYHKYQLAARQDDMDSFADNNSCGSIPIGRSRATSSTTLLSEVISLQRFRTNKHARLAEEDLEMQEETGSKVDEGTELLEKSRSDDDQKSDVGSDSERRPTTLEVPKTPQLPRRQLRLLKNRKFISPVSPVAEGPEDDTAGATAQDTGTLKAPTRAKSRATSRPSASSSQSSTLTNGSSPPSTASISGLTSSKECKEKKNRERMLAGSEFSLNADLEMDYYDYNVQNSVPGSYLAMDPAYCLWIPPFAPGVWEEETEFMGSPEERKSDKSEEAYKSADSLNFKQNDLSRSASNRALNTVIYTTEDDSSTGLMEKAAVPSPVKVHQYPSKNREKETVIEKSPSGSEYYDLLENEGGIRFADEDDDEDDGSTVLEDFSDLEKEVKDLNIREKDTKSTVIVQVHSRSAVYNK